MRHFSFLAGAALLAATLFHTAGYAHEPGGGHGGHNGGHYGGGGGARYGGFYYPHQPYAHYGPYRPGLYAPYGYYRPYYGYGFFGPGLGFGGVGLGLGGYGLGGYGLYRPYYGGVAVVTPAVGVPVVGGPAVVDPGVAAPGIATAQTAPPPLADGGAPPAQTAPPPDNAAHLQLVVPENAEVLFDGGRTTQMGPTREFVSPQLPAGKLFDYTITVRYTDPSGKPITDKRVIHVRANDWFRIDFTRPAPPEPLPAP